MERNPHLDAASLQSASYNVLSVWSWLEVSKLAAQPRRTEKGNRGCKKVVGRATESERGGGEETDGLTDRQIEGWRDGGSMGEDVSRAAATSPFTMRLNRWDVKKRREREAERGRRRSCTLHSASLVWKNNIQIQNCTSCIWCVVNKLLLCATETLETLQKWARIKGWIKCADDSGQTGQTATWLLLYSWI